MLTITLSVSPESILVPFTPAPAWWSLPFPWMNLHCYLDTHQWEVSGTSLLSYAFFVSCVSHNPLDMIILWCFHLLLSFLKTEIETHENLSILTFSTKIFLSWVNFHALITFITMQSASLKYNDSYISLYIFISYMTSTIRNGYKNQCNISNNKHIVLTVQVNVYNEPNETHHTEYQ